MRSDGVEAKRNPRAAGLYLHHRTKDFGAPMNARAGNRLHDGGLHGLAGMRTGSIQARIKADGKNRARWWHCLAGCRERDAEKHYP